MRKRYFSFFAFSFSTLPLIYSHRCIFYFIAVLIDLEKEISELKLNKEKEMKAGGEFMFELLGKTKLAFDTYLPIYQITDAAVAYLTSGCKYTVNCK